MKMKKQANPSSAATAVASSKAGLLDLPENCLHHIASFMDKETKLQFFKTSKGTTQQPGCAVLVLRTAKLSRCNTDDAPRPALRSLLHWAAQISTDMQLSCRSYARPPASGPQRVIGPLHSLLLYPQARATRSGHVTGKPLTYPGITSLVLDAIYTCSSFIPGLVADAFPNLKSFTAIWEPDGSQPLGPVLRRGLSSVQHVAVNAPFHTFRAPSLIARQHIGQQLSLMPSLTSLDVVHSTLPLVPPAVLAKLKRLHMYAHDVPTATDKAALKACTQLESLEIENYGNRWRWVQVLPQHVPSIRTLNTVEPMTDEHLPYLLALPHLTSLTVSWLPALSDDYSSAPCSWNQLRFDDECSSAGITKLPLYALDSPVQRSSFKIVLTEPEATAGFPAIRAAKPHLLRCGGKVAELVIVSEDLSDELEDPGVYMEELLREWAPCLSVPTKVRIDGHIVELVAETVLALWPGVDIAVMYT